MSRERERMENNATYETKMRIVRNNKFGDKSKRVKTCSYSDILQMVSKLPQRVNYGGMLMKGELANVMIIFLTSSGMKILNNKFGKDFHI